MTVPLIVYISIGNSDDKLSQADWSDYVVAIDLRLLDRSTYPESVVKRRHGYWHSLPTDPWQNACWCVELDNDEGDWDEIDVLKADLRYIADDYRQTSVAWAVAATEFLEP